MDIPVNVKVFKESGKYYTEETCIVKLQLSDIFLNEVFNIDINAVVAKVIHQYAEKFENMYLQVELPHAGIALITPDQR